MENCTWDNPFGGVELDDAFEESPSLVDERLEAQPHGGALLRREAVGPDPDYRSDLSKAKLLQFPIPQSAAPWPAGLVFDLSIGLDSTVTILDRYGLTSDDYERLLSIPAFRRELALEMKKNQEEGISFSRKTAAIAEDCIPDMYAIIKDPLVPASARADIFKYFTKVGRLEPSEKSQGANSAVQVQIQINL